MYFSYEPCHLNGRKYQCELVTHSPSTLQWSHWETHVHLIRVNSDSSGHINRIMAKDFRDKWEGSRGMEVTLNVIQLHFSLGLVCEWPMPPPSIPSSLPSSSIAHRESSKILRVLGFPRISTLFAFFSKLLLPTYLGHFLSKLHVLKCQHSY